MGAGDGGPRLHAREIAVIHEALVAAWRLLRDGLVRGRGPFPLVEGLGLGAGCPGVRG